MDATISPTTPSPFLQKAGELAVLARLPEGLVLADTILDFVPLGSTATNLVDLGLKHFVLNNVNPESSVFRQYIEHIQKKESTTCLAYSVPILGNLYKVGASFYAYSQQFKDNTVLLKEGQKTLPYMEEYEGSTIGDRLTSII